MMYTKFWKEKLVFDSKEVLSDVEGLLAITGEEISDKAKEVKGRLGDRLTTAKAQLKEVQAVLSDKAVAGAKQTDGAIRDNVYTSLGIAAAAGLFMGIVLARR